MKYAVAKRAESYGHAAVLNVDPWFRSDPTFDPSEPKTPTL
jgi:hypothetical protein